VGPPICSTADKAKVLIITLVQELDVWQKAGQKKLNLEKELLITVTRQKSF